MDRNFYNRPTDEDLRELSTMANGLKADLNPLDEEALANIREIKNTMIELEDSAMAMQSQGRKSAPQQPQGSMMVQPGRNTQAWGNDGRGGFQNFGEFALEVNRAARGLKPDQRVMNAPTTFSTEGVGADGGFAVPPDFRTEIWNKISGENSILALTHQMPTTSNNIEVPADETAPWDTSSGVQAYWVGEAEQLTQSKVALKSKTMRLNKLAVLVPVTEELMEDAPGLDAHLRRKVAALLDFKIGLSIVQGTGAGQPLGLLNSASIISVAKEGSQDTDSLLWENVLKMWSKLDANCAENAVWLCNPSVRPQLLQMYASAGDTGVPVYLPANSAAPAPYQTLMGRPIIFTQACNPLGDQGDIILTDLSQYWTAVQGQGIRSDVSIHLWFDYDMLAYRFIIRITGQPWWATPITGRDGSSTYSWAVTLDERA